MLDLAERKMPRDVSTRWNSTYDMLDFAVGYQSAIDDMTGDKSTNLRKYELDDGEWKIAEQLRDTLRVRVSQTFKGPIWQINSQFEYSRYLLQIFKDATLFFSRSTPCLAMVIPAMDHINETLTNNSLDHKFEPSIRAALGIAKKTLNRYYNATDQSEVYRIAMGT
jgi:hypothetical protein